MRWTQGFRVGLALLVMTGTMALLGGCSGNGVPDGTLQQIQVGTMQVTAINAGLVNADTGKVAFQVKCGDCGFVDQVVTVDTPVVGKPYTSTWVCPKCKHKQKVTITFEPAPVKK